MPVEKLKEFLEDFNASRLREKEIDFLSFFDEKVEEMKLTGKGGARNYQSAYNSLTKYLDNKCLMFSDINVKFLKGYEKYLAENAGERAVL